MTLKLFYAPGSCATASFLALEEAGADFEAERMDLASGRQRSPEYLAINPKGRVPALVTDKGVLTETPAILTWVAQTYPKARLAPFDDPWAFAQAQSFNAYLCSTVHIAHAHKYRGARWADDAASIAAMAARAGSNMADAFDYIEKDLVKGPWVLGDDYSVCDAYLYTVAGWLPAHDIDIARFPKVAAHNQRMLARPAVQAMIARQAAQAAQAAQ